jgi:hypothetical protein
MSAGYPTELDTLFGDYPLDQAFDEMRTSNGELRQHYRALAETLVHLPAEELQRRKSESSPTTCFPAWLRRKSGTASSGA